MGNIKNLIGTTVNKLTVISQATSSKYRSKWVCRCECGNEIILPSYTIWRGKIKSCGCHNKYKGLSVKYNDIYRLWFYMKERCYNTNVQNYKYYGERSIMVCDEWNEDFPRFCNWALENGWKKGLQLDRKDNNKNYDSNNCRFVTPIVNGNNKRNNKVLTYNGEQKSLSDWARLYNIKPSLLSKRLNAKWSLEKALITPSKKNKN